MLNELSVVGKLLYQVVPVLCCLDTDDKNVKMTELQNSRFRALAKTPTHAQAQQSPAKGVLTCINHEGSERGQWPKVSQRCFLPLLFTAKECMLSPGQAWPPGAAPRIEPFIRPRLQGGTHRARSTKPNSSSPDWGKRRLKPPSRAFPVLSFLASPAAQPVLSTHSTDSSEPLHSSFTKRPVEQPIKGHREGRPHVQIPPSRPGPSLRESGVGGGRQRSVISTVSGCSPWNPGRRLGLGGPLFRDRRTELVVDRNSVSWCSVSAFVWTHEHMFAAKQSSNDMYFAVRNNNEPQGGSFRSRQAAQKIKKARAQPCMYLCIKVGI
jgi:hypothetical protein